MGMNIPLTKMSGKRTRLESIMMYDGLGTDGDASNTPRDEKQREPKSMPAIKIKIFRL